MLFLSCRDKGFVVEALSRFGGFDVADDGLFDRHGTGPAGCAVGDLQIHLAKFSGFGCCLCARGGISGISGRFAGVGRRLFSRCLRLDLGGERCRCGRDQSGRHDESHASEQGLLQTDQFISH